MNVYIATWAAVFQDKEIRSREAGVLVVKERRAEITHPIDEPSLKPGSNKERISLSFRNLTFDLLVKSSIPIVYIDSV